MSVPDRTVRDEAGRWVVPPKSPGRPVGPSAAERIAEYIRPSEKAIVDKVVELAKLGDPRSAELALKYICPPARPEDEKVCIPGFSEAPTLKQKAEAVIYAAAQGHCSTAAAERLLRVLDVYGRAALADEFEARLQALEGGPARAKPIDVIDAAPTPAMPKAPAKSGRPRKVRIEDAQPVVHAQPIESTQLGANDDDTCDLV